MKNVWLIFRLDLRHLMNNAIAAIVVVGLVLVPPMYAWFTTLGFWDPYSNTGNLSVAVANNDAGYKSDLIPVRVNAGDQIIGQLRANSQFDWQFVSEDEAVDGVKSGRYYAAIVIPAGFSADLMTVFSDDIRHSEIIYYTNEKLNAIAPKITDTGATTLKAQIDESFTKTVADVALDMTSNLTDYVSGDGVASYAAMLQARIASAAETLRATASLSRTYEGLVETAANLVNSAGKALDAAAGTNESNAQAIGGARDALAEGKGAMSGAAELLGSTLDGAGAAFDTIDSALDSVMRTMKDDPAAAQAVLADMQGYVKTAISDYRQLRDVASEFGASEVVIAAINNAIEDLERLYKDLGNASDALEEASDTAQSQWDAARASVASARANLADFRDNYVGEISAAANDLADTLENVLGTASDLNDRLAKTARRLSGKSGSVASDMHDLQNALSNTSAVLDDSAAQLEETNARLSDAISRNDIDEVKRIIGSNPEKVASFLSAPTELVKHAVWHMPNNGSSMSPFYTSLALWIGSIFLVALTSPFVSQRRQRMLKDPKPWQMYLGRYLIFGMLALCQATVLCLGNVFFLGVECEHFWLYLLACWITGIVFSNVVYTLAISFGNVGKAVAVILLVMQLAGSGGIFPVQMSAEFFQWVYPWLPFSHSMEAFESAMAGIYGMQYWVSIARLLVLLVPSLLLGLVLRRPVIRMNDYINRKLDETELV